jgi:hypothetical protein
MKQNRYTTNRSAAFVSTDFFTNAESQDFAFRLSERGVDELARTFARTMRSRGDIQRVLAACELLAAANGYADEAAGRCALVDEWLFKSGYVPDPATLDLARQRLDRIMVRENVAADLNMSGRLFLSLRARLAKRPKRVKRKLAKDDRPGFRALSRWLNESQGEVDDGPEFDRRGDARVVQVYVTVNAACKLINYRKVSVLELWLNNNNDANELSAAVKILLRGWRGTLKAVEFDHVPDGTIPRDAWHPPYRALTHCRDELAALPVLESFTTRNMYFEDQTLRAVCQNPRLKRITVSNAKVSRKGFRRIAVCKTLEGVSVTRCPGINQTDREYLATRLPRVQYVTIGD